ncbi:MAG TPA: MOSC domain-containing protein [Candidatus Binatia bacterium]|nr:MOSC domain-containing protein [Candidatus Binatia bacterium]
MIEVNQIECVAGRGIRGDRFFDFKENYKGQITFFCVEVFEALRRELNLPQVQPSATRRNLLVAGMDLNELIGAEFEFHGVRFTGVEECKPCYWMNSALGPGAEDWLQGRGGLRARILTDGILRCATCCLMVDSREASRIEHRPRSHPPLTSQASRRPSPRKFSANSAVTKNPPGKPINHQ